VGDLAFTIPTLSEPWMGKLSEDEKWMFDYDSTVEYYYYFEPFKSLFCSKSKDKDLLYNDERLPEG